mmetsp:Transcript_29251/g.28345  ORF Transcript_29251/g.28345 Transcript_29251/m.28345 type:complete len:92 (-) Transcript_29251:431-706(-)
MRKIYFRSQKDFIRLPDGSLFNGRLVKGEPHGQGIIIHVSHNHKTLEIISMYDGNLNQGKADGFGILIFEKGLGRYEGYWKKGKYEGKGIY